MGDVNNSMVRLARFAAIVLAVCLIDAAVGVFAAKPMPWVAVIPTAIPLLVALGIIAPLQRARKQ